MLENAVSAGAEVGQEIRAIFSHEARRLGAVPLLAPVAQEVAALLQDPGAGMNQVALVVRKDPAMAANLLRVANSAAYAGASPFTTIPSALVRLGATGIRRFLLTAAANRVLNIRSRGNLSLRLQVRSVGVGHAAARVATHFGTDPEVAFLGGLLHDVGWAMGYAALPAVLPRLPAEYRQKPAALDALVEHLHADLGSAVAEAWNLPAMAVDAIRAHHDPVSLGGGLIAHVVHAGTRICDLAGIGLVERPAVDLPGEVVFQRLKLDQAGVDRIAAALKIDMTAR